MLERTALWCYSRRRAVLALWIVAFIGLGVVGKLGAGPFSTDFETPGSESKAAHELLKSKFPEQSGDSITVIYKAERGVADPAVRPRLDALVAELRTNPHVVSVVTPYDAQGAQQVSPSDPTIAFATLQLDIQGSDFPIEDAKAMMATAADANGANSEGGRVQFELGGFAIQNAEFENGGSSEGAGTLAAIVILLIAFGSVLAMGLPILTAVMGIGIGLAIIEVLANVVDVPNFTSIVAAMIGLGVGIDYALFIVTRYREGLHAGMDPERATVVAISTAGRAVLFAGTTVVISVLGMLLMNLPFLEGVAVGSAAVVLVTMIGSVTLLPAMLGFVGTNIDRWKVPFVGRGGHDHRAGFWFRWSRLIQRRPWIFFGAGLVALLLLAAPIFSLRLGFPGDESAPDSRTSRRAYDLYAAGFGPGFAAPLLMVVELPGGQGVATVGQLETRLRTAEGVAAATPARLNAAGDTAVITVFPTTSGTSEKTVELVNRLRNEVIPTVVAGTPVTVSVGGPNASFIDQSQAITDRLPIFIAVVVGLSFLLLMAVFRSVLVALKAAVMNLLSIAAAYGVLVAVAQWGWGKDLFGISATGPIANFIPMMMFAILFGLSMDYEVFLLSRIREEYVKTGDNGLAVADGLASTARVITAAAAIMIMVFLSFVLGPELVIKQIGLGLAVAILIDATLVRMVLVPATMELLGKANWWLPRWLDRLLPHVGFDGAEEADLDRELEELTTARR
ncbi:MAG: putative drug exporter of the superfamily [Actinomycetota bacterium]|nr:putative drug exporter of the superfamily [Actinomycetota bacterium]